MKVYKRKLAPKINAKDRERIRIRDKVCRICGSDKGLRVCHILPRRDYPSLTHKVKNMVLLCALCDWEFGEILDQDWVKKKYKGID